MLALNYHNRPAGKAVTPSSMVRDVWGSYPGTVRLTQCCQLLITAATFLRKELCCSGVMTRSWAPQTRYTLRHNTASITKDLVWLIRKKVEKWKSWPNWFATRQRVSKYFCFAQHHANVEGLLTVEGSNPLAPPKSGPDYIGIEY